ncbi:hypothetical protein POTOM_057734 [Populus tomentosa]|uniref:60S ribosomal protein L12 n=1 Tax=Populus tomentosa TaxID=118781 RepID=A0A8X7XZD8_POPTO|nr:hypothetical protein POTOM_057734 [Populus tomentosa]
MPPKFDPSQVVDVYVRVTGGEVGAASSLAPKIGPLGLSPKKIGEDIAKETAKDWKGLRVTVKLTVQNRQAKVTVVPSAAALVIKALKEPERDRKKTKNIKHNGNISLDDVIEIAKVMSVRSMAKDLSGTVKEILGTCVSVGCTVDGKDPKDLQQEITDGKYGSLVMENSFKFMSWIETQGFQLVLCHLHEFCRLVSILHFPNVPSGKEYVCGWGLAIDKNKFSQECEFSVMLRFHYLSNNDETTVLGSDYPASLLFREGQFSAVDFRFDSYLVDALNFSIFVLVINGLFSVVLFGSREEICAGFVSFISICYEINLRALKIEIEEGDLLLIRVSLKTKGKSSSGKGAKGVEEKSASQYVKEWSTWTFKKAKFCNGLRYGTGNEMNSGYSVEAEKDFCLYQAAIHSLVLVRVFLTYGNSVLLGKCMIQSCMFAIDLVSRECKIDLSKLFVWSAEALLLSPSKYTIAFRMVVLVHSWDFHTEFAAQQTNLFKHFAAISIRLSAVDAIM